MRWKEEEGVEQREGVGEVDTRGKGSGTSIGMVGDEGLYDWLPWGLRGLFYAWL